MKTKSLIGMFLAVALGISVQALAAPGNFDTTFHSPLGFTVYAPAFHAKAVAVQPDGKSVAAGTAWNGTDLDVVVVRFLIDGSVDPSFGVEGAQTFDCAGGEDLAEDVAVQPDGRIIVVGKCWMKSSSDAWILRLTPDGNLDTSFGIGGTVRYNGPANQGDNANAVLLQSDGKILVAGSSYTGTSVDALVIRLEPTGFPDLGFGNSGVVLYDGKTSGGDFAVDLALQSDGKLVIVGSTGVALGNDALLVLRLLPDGLLDSSFGKTGTVSFRFSPLNNDYGNAVALQADGKILVAGTSFQGLQNPDVLLLRLDSSGSLDKGFGSGGHVFYAGLYGKGDFGNDLVVQLDGRIMVAGATQTFIAKYLDQDLLVLRYLQDGTLDPDFGTGGIVTYNGAAAGSDEANAIMLQSDGKILVAGESMNTLTGYASRDLFMLRLIGQEFTPDILANSGDGPLSLPTTDPVTVSATTLGPATPGSEVDWWVAAMTPWGGYYFDLTGGWHYDPIWAHLAPAAQGSLIGFPPIPVISLAGMPPGQYVLYFGFDMNANGMLDYGSLYYDSATVNVY